MRVECQADTTHDKSHNASAQYGVHRHSCDAYVLRFCIGAKKWQVTWVAKIVFHGGAQTDLPNSKFHGPTGLSALYTNGKQCCVQKHNRMQYGLQKVDPQL